MLRKLVIDTTGGPNFSNFEDLSTVFFSADRLRVCLPANLFDLFAVHDSERNGPQQLGSRDRPGYPVRLLRLGHRQTGLHNHQHRARVPCP